MRSACSGPAWEQGVLTFKDSHREQIAFHVWFLASLCVVLLELPCNWDFDCWVDHKHSAGVRCFVIWKKTTGGLSLYSLEVPSLPPMVSLQWTSF